MPTTRSGPGRSPHPQWLPIALAMLALAAMVLSGLVHAAAARRTGRPVALLLAPPESQQAKADLIAHTAEQRGFEAVTIFPAGLPDDEVNAAIDRADVVLVDWTSTATYESLLARFASPLERHRGVVFPGKYFARPGLSRGLSPAQARTVFEWGPAPKPPRPARGGRAAERTGSKR